MTENPLSAEDRAVLFARLEDQASHLEGRRGAHMTIPLADFRDLLAIAKAAPITTAPTEDQRAAATRLMDAAQDGKIRGDDVQEIINAAWVSNFQMEKLRQENEALLALLRSAVSIAGRAAEEWDAAPAGMKAGKIILALAGHVPGYLPETDAIHAALKDAAE